MRKTKAPPAVELLARLLREALTAAWIAHNPNHDHPDFAAVKHLGRVGYERVAAELLRRIKGPVEAAGPTNLQRISQAIHESHDGWRGTYQI
jgi:hypothetical protein